MKLRERMSKPLSKRQIAVNVDHLSSELVRKKATLAMSPPLAGNKRLRARPQSTAAEQCSSVLSTCPQSKKRRDLMEARGTIRSVEKIPSPRKCISAFCKFVENRSRSTYFNTTNNKTTNPRTRNHFEKPSALPLSVGFKQSYVSIDDFFVFILLYEV